VRPRRCVDVGAEHRGGREVAVGGVGRQHAREQVQPIPGVDRVVESDDQVVAQRVLGN
jgi:hypothetical protein